MSKFYAYFRVSTQSQMEANGLSMQIAEVEKYCAEKEIVLDGTFKDEGVSGTIVDRDGITELLSVLEQDDTIIVLNTSRLWRSDMAKVMIRRQIEKIGANVVSIEQPAYNIYSKDPNDFLINGMMELLDQYDRMAIAMKLAKGRRSRASKGYKACGTAPFGYRWEGNNVVPDYNNHKVVQLIFQEYIFTKSLASVSEMLKKQGFKTTAGCDFSKTTLKRMIENDFYIGVVTHAGKKTVGHHEAIIDENLFREANRILKRNTLTA